MKPFNLLVKLFFLVGMWVVLGRGLTADEFDFSQDVLPILSSKCFACHGPDAATREADLRLDTFAGATVVLGGHTAVVPSDPDSSLLIERINDDDDPMPPLDSKLSLSDAEKAVLRKWIASGAAYQPHWAFVPPQSPELPNIEGVLHPVDRFVAESLQAHGLKSSPEASPQRLIRRVTLDLTGLPPTPAEVNQFVQQYQQRGEAAYEEWVDRLIASPRYGETMALPWLDGARYADTNGYQFDGPRYQWRWRDWVIAAYNANMPFDQFTIEQLAGDLIPGATLDQVIATGFNRNHRYNAEAGLVVEESLLENVVDRVDTVGTLWMATTLGCARCHDHKFDPISQKEYYQLTAFFNNIPEAGRAIRENNSEPLILAPTAEQQPVHHAKRDAVEKAWKKVQNFQYEPVKSASFGTNDALEEAENFLIDRKLIRHYPLQQLPETHAKPIGRPRFEEDALILDGQSQLEIGNQEKSIVARAGAQFTVSFWMKPDSLADAVILSRQQNSNSRAGIEVAMVDGGRIQFDLILSWIAGAGRVRTQLSVEPEKWVHVTVSNDGSHSANGQKIFINGRHVETEVLLNTNSSVGGGSENRPLIIGRGVRPDSGSFSGGIRDVRMYQTDLWPEEIEVLGAEANDRIRKRFARLKSEKIYLDYVELREDLERYEAKLPTVMVMQENATPNPTHLRKRGVYDQLGELVQREVPALFPAMDQSLPKDRLGFAKWLVSEEHPLTARVAVNRYWQKYFGTGLVKTSEDFGVQGQLPSHPKLLDWLAVEFIRSGWDVAAMQKMIVTSRTYRQQSQVSSEMLLLDPENRLLARGPRMRLPAHVIRDQALSVSGLLVEEIGGPSVYPYQPPGLWEEMSMGMKYKQSSGASLYRRSLYTVWKRTVSPPALALFDAADRETCSVSRQQTNTPLQALTLLNETGFVEAARHFAEQMVETSPSEPLVFGFECVTARKPHDRELAVLERALEKYREDFVEHPESALEILKVGDSPPTKAEQPVEMAAMTMVANLLLNLDESINKE